MGTSAEGPHILRPSSPDSELAASAPFVFRPYRSNERQGVYQLLSILPSIYPGGAKWLKRRLEDSTRSRATCTLATYGPRPVGITIETPKDCRKLKLSTLYVDPSFRGCGIGTSLLSLCVRRWLRDCLHDVYITTDLRRARNIIPVLTRYQFKPTCIEYDRYGKGRHEMILSWSSRNR